MESNRTRPGGGRPVAADRPPADRPPNRRRRDRPPLHLVPDPVYVAASPDMEQAARELVGEARVEALQDAQLAVEHLQRAVDLLGQAASIERVIRA